MSVRRYLSAVLILSGVVLLGIAALHYCRGHLAQIAGRRDWERSLAATPSFTAAAPAAIESTPKENPGITAVLPPPAAPAAAARP